MMVVEGYNSPLDLSEDFCIPQHNVVEFVNEAAKLSAEMLDKGYSQEYADQQYEKYIMRKVRALSNEIASEQFLENSTTFSENNDPVEEEVSRQPAYFYNLADKQQVVEEPVQIVEPVVEESSDAHVESKKSFGFGKIIIFTFQVAFIAYASYAGLNFVSGLF